MSLPSAALNDAKNERPPFPGDAAIVCRQLTKRYQLGEHRSLQKTLASLGPRKVRNEALAAIDNVSLNISAGGATGLVGGNGSGKSTLLQIIAGITVPTTGYAQIRGRVLPLLAVGTGFHPELTGRENVVLFGTVLGIPRRTAAQRVDDIFEFAEIARHVDTPTKRYSDGMRSRLSFAIAMRFPADIYIFDEVLAMADEDFRSRCIIELDRLACSGRTVIFVSHDSTLVERLCRTVIWLDQGRVRMVGNAAEVLPQYRSHHRTSSS
jgi:ABC-type polysaccharide/polyol phosphate transport system ATPase subunit